MTNTYNGHSVEEADHSSTVPYLIDNDVFNNLIYSEVI
jgi:hypothetical protein